MAQSAIEWTDQTWNPVTGCDRVSPGCANCYALTMARRLKAMGQPGYQRDGGRASGPGFGVTLHPEKLDEPLRWRKPRRVFVNSMSDLFHEEVPFEFIAEVFDVMTAADRHTFQVLTKRPERALAFWRWCLSYEATLPDLFGMSLSVGRSPMLPPNVWLGVSVENARFTWRADTLRQIPAAVRFISAEPLLGSLFDPIRCVACREGVPRSLVWGCADAYIHNYGGEPGTIAPCTSKSGPLDLTGIDWIIAGAESGHGARPMDEDWVREIRDACQAAGVAFFYKQNAVNGRKISLPALDGRRLTEFPSA